jgi:pimeloyl-ACP methyl ester carboxylesterase
LCNGAELNSPVCCRAGFHVVVPDLPGHGEHKLGERIAALLQLGSAGAHGARWDVPGKSAVYSPAAMAEQLARFRVDVLGATRMHHVVGVGLGASVAMEYARLPGVGPYLASATLLSPFGVEPVSDAFRAFFNPTLATRMVDPKALAKAFRSKLTNRPLWRPAAHFNGAAADWAKEKFARADICAALVKAHTEGDTYKNIEQESSGLPVCPSLNPRPRFYSCYHFPPRRRHQILVLFGELNTLAKDFGSPVELPALKHANANLKTAKYAATYPSPSPRTRPHTH